MFRPGAVLVNLLIVLFGAVFSSMIISSHCLFVLLLYIPVNSYGHYGMVSSPNHTFVDKLEQAVKQYFVHILSLVTDNNPS